MSILLNHISLYLCVLLHSTYKKKANLLHYIQLHCKITVFLCKSIGIVTLLKVFELVSLFSTMKTIWFTTGLMRLNTHSADSLTCNQTSITRKRNALRSTTTVSPAAEDEL